MSETRSKRFNFIRAYKHILLVIFIFISISAVPVFAIDETAPTTTDNSTSTWTNYNQTILLTATDDDTGVNTTKYCIGANTCAPNQIGTVVDITCNPDIVCQVYVRYQSTDNAGNNETIKTSNLIQIDKIKPIISDDYSLKDNIWQNNSQTINLEVSDIGSLTDRTFTKYCISTNSCYPSIIYGGKMIFSDEGITYLMYTTADKARNIPEPETSTTIIKIDKTGPTVDAGTDKTTNTEILQTATATDTYSGVASYNWTNVSGPGIITFGAPTEETTTISADTDGTYTIRLTVTDNVGNTGYDEMTLVWDETLPNAPNITLLDPIIPANEMAITITGTGEPNAIINYLIFDSLLNNITGNSTVKISGNINITDIDVSTLADGTLTVSVILTDIVGNIGLARTDNATKDTTAPTAPNITLLNPITFANKESVTITGTGEPNAIINYLIIDSISNNLTGTSTVNISGNINITDIDVSNLSDGTLNVSVILTDSFGNIGLTGTDTATKDTYVAPIEEPTTPSRGSRHIIQSYCGDNICQSTETYYDPRTDIGCEADCGILEYCGDNICQTNENYNECSLDCVDNKIKKTYVESIPDQIIEPTVPSETDTSTIDTTTSTDTTTDAQVSPLTGFVTANIERLNDSKTSIFILIVLFIIGLYLLKKRNKPKTEKYEYTKNNNIENQESIEESKTEDKKPTKKSNSFS
ncbi:MAG: hypothetical protein K0B07_04200 [DPANN group archaeon]|nr:hypothetical protein [DPANN group archaeon]